MTLDFNIHSITPVEESGSITPSGTKVITENGVYNVTTYASASVDVEGSEPTLVTKTITSNGTYAASADNADGYSSVSVNVSATEPTLTSLTVTPSTTEQTLTPIDADGFSTVVVSGVTSSIDADIQAGNIKSGVDILGVTGNLTALVSETTTITSNGTYVPTTGNGFTSVSVNVSGTTPTGTYTITTNGTYDVTNYASADVSVSGGGGSEFDDIDTMVSEAVTWLEGKSYKNCYDNGWLVASSRETSTSQIYQNDANTVSGVVFATNSPDSVFVKGRAFKAPAGSTISTDGLSSMVHKITFPSGCTNKWLISAGEMLITTAAFFGLHQIAFTSNVTNASECKQIVGQYRYINISLRQNTYTSQSPYSVAYPTDVIWQYARNLEGLKLSDNITFTLSTYLSGSSATFLQYLAFSKNVDLKDFFEKHISDATYQTTALSTSISDDLIRSNSNMRCWVTRKDFPFIVDCGGFPSSALSNTWYVGYVPFSMSSYYTEFGGFTDVKIKIPAMNIKLNYEGNRYVPIEYLSYMATNAPTASKTITFGSNLLAIVQSIDSTIISTLTGKGWTVN